MLAWARKLTTRRSGSSTVKGSSNKEDRTASESGANGPTKKPFLDIRVLRRQPRGSGIGRGGGRLGQSSALSRSSCASTARLSESEVSSVTSSSESNSNHYVESSSVSFRNDDDGHEKQLRAKSPSPKPSPSSRPSVVVNRRKKRRESKLDCLPEHSPYCQEKDTDTKNEIHWSCPHSSTEDACSYSRARNECGICSEPILGPRFVGACLPCGHFFHEDCFFGSWASTLLRGMEQDNNNNKDDGKLSSKGKSVVSPQPDCFSPHCLQCGALVQDFGRIAISAEDAMGPSDVFEQSFNEFFLQNIISKAKMVSLVRRCIAGPSSPKMVIQVLRVMMDRFSKSNNSPNSTGTNDGGNAAKAEFLAVGGHVAMMQAIARYSDNEEIWAWVNAVMAEISLGQADVLYITTPNLAGFVASSMRKYPRHRPLLSNGCCTFSELCKSRFAKQALEDIYRADGLGQVTGAIARFPLEETSSLRWNAISFLILAAEIDPMLVCEHVCSDVDAFDSIICALHESIASFSPIYGRLVCALLLIASRRPEFRNSIIKAGGVHALQVAYMLSPDDKCKDMARMILRRLGRPLHPARSTLSKAAI